MTRAGELREMTDDMLSEHIRTTRQELFGLRFRHATGELENTAGVGAAKRELARSLTIAKQRGIQVEDESSN